MIRYQLDEDIELSARRDQLGEDAELFAGGGQLAMSAKHRSP